MEEINEAKLDEVRFIHLVMMLSDGAMQHLGKVANPLTGKCERNLEAAAATIDTIKMLKEKTKGNLSENESKVLSTILANLQLNYADEVKKQGVMGEEGEEKEKQEGGEKERQEGEKERQEGEG